MRRAGPSTRTVPPYGMTSWGSVCPRSTSKTAIVSGAYVAQRPQYRLALLGGVTARRSSGSSAAARTTRSWDGPSAARGSAAADRARPCCAESGTPPAARGSSSEVSRTSTPPSYAEVAPDLAVRHQQPGQDLQIAAPAAALHHPLGVVPAPAVARARVSGSASKVAGSAQSRSTSPNRSAGRSSYGPEVNSAARSESAVSGAMATGRPELASSRSRRGSRRSRCSTGSRAGSCCR